MSNNLPTVAETKSARRDRISNRSLAIIEQALDRILRDGGKHAAERLAASFDADPRAWLDWAFKHGLEPGAADQKPSNINNLFLLASKQAAAQLPVLDVEVTEVERVQSGSGGSEPIDW